MDTVSVVNLVGSCDDVLDLVDKSIKNLHFSQEHNSSTVTLLDGQLVKLHTALQQAEQWIQYDLVSTERHHHQFIVELETALSACKLLVSLIHQSTTKKAHHDSGAAKSRIRAVWEERVIKDCLAHLTWQVSAFNLLISAFQWWVFRAQGVSQVLIHATAAPGVSKNDCWKPDGAGAYLTKCETIHHH
jgi:hypothetical protein